METLLHIGLTNALAASALALLVAALARLVRRPALVHSLWVLVLLKLIVPPLLPVHVNWPAANRQPPLAAPAVASVVVVEIPAELALQADAAAPAAPLPPPVPSLVERVTRVDWRPWAAGVWLAGSAIWLAWAVVRMSRFGRALRVASEAPEELRVQVDKLAMRLGLRKAPEAGVVPGAISPFVWAVGGRARLVVPEALWKRLDHEQRSALLIHELAHLRRRDHWVRALELVATGLYWWHPVVWWARRALRDAEEQCCDAWVVWARPGSAKAYATALLETVDFLAGACSRLPVAASGIGHVDHLKRRLTMILSGVTPKGLSWAGRLFILGMAGALLPLAPSAAQDPAPEPAESQAVIVSEDEGMLTAVVPELVYKEAVADEERDLKENDEEKAKRSDADQKRVDEKDQAKDAVSKAEIDKARAELKEAEARLSKAAKRLAELEGRRSGRDGRWEVKTEDGKYVVIERRVEGTPRTVARIRVDGNPKEAEAVVRELQRKVVKVPPRPPVPPLPAMPGRPGAAGRFGVRDLRLEGDYEARMRELENKLDRLTDEIKSLRKEKERGPSRDRESGDSKREGF